MTFDPQGTFLHYYENQSEKSGNDFDFVHKHQCWGTFVESLLNNEIVLSDDPTICPPAFSKRHSGGASAMIDLNGDGIPDLLVGDRDRKSTRLNSSHVAISYAVFCLKIKK